MESYFVPGGGTIATWFESSTYLSYFLIIQKDVYYRKPAEVIPEMMLGYKIDKEYAPSHMAQYPIYYERDEAGLPTIKLFVQIGLLSHG